jgi:putative transposase
MDWFSRRVMAWRLSNTLDVSFCTEALEEALEKFGPPEIFNSDWLPVYLRGIYKSPHLE